MFALCHILALLASLSIALVLTSALYLATLHACICGGADTRIVLEKGAVLAPLRVTGGKEECCCDDLRVAISCWDPLKGILSCSVLALFLSS